MSSADSDFDGSLVETRQEPLGRWLSEIPVRSLLASYEVSTQELGRGGFGTVVVGRKRHLPQAVAIKRIHADLKFSASDQRRFVREVQLLAPLQHPNIVRVEDWGRDDAGLYLVMELIDGPNLATLVNQCGGPLSLTQLLDFTAQICRALQWAHQHGIVHRDLKPANLLLDRFGVIKLGDFGLARVDPNVREGLTSSGAVQAFTYAYASPEQLRGDSVVDGRSDLFSLGATLYHLATGRADTSRTFDLDALPASLAPLQPLLSGLLRPNLARRLPDVAAVLQVLDEVTRAASPSGADAVAAVATASQISEVVADGSCWKCQRVNGLSQKFCSGCGSGLYEACLATACQAQIRVWDAFCAECGADQA
ncbi:MAG: serine/threonine-protein kinase, partial [Planctomyces sp.]